VKTQREVIRYDPPRHKITRKQYERLCDEGYFDTDKKLDLVDGEVVVLSAEGPVHTGLIQRLFRMLERCFGPDYFARAGHELPIPPDDDNANPMPDIAIIKGDPLDPRYLKRHPRKAALVVEVSHTTLRRDRKHKGSIYAMAGIKEYWIVNVSMKTIEIYTSPVESPSGKYGWIYADIEKVRSGSVRPRAARGEPIALRDIFRGL
jgi:Uma2 family endonuclease